ncbi:MAG: tetrahydrofolate dehydrogenase/cyclohydrolase catalytic domain-containing protein, partial [Candidatus Promineifilaceae bacterium]
MTANIIDGKQIAADIRQELADAVAAMKAEHGYTPGLATVLVGDDTASATYVRMKQKACAEAGIRSIGHNLPEDSSGEEVLELVTALNANPEVNGILVQLPLPSQV